MNRKVSYLLTSAMVAGTVLISAPAVYANDLVDTLRGYLNNAAGGPDFTDRMQDTINNLNTTEAKIRTRIDAGLASGQLSAATASDMRIELNRIISLQGTYVGDGSLAYGEAQALVTSLSSLESRLNQELAAHPVGSNSTHVATDFGAKIQQLHTRVTAGLQAGRLTADEAHDLRHKLDALAAKESTFDDDGYSGWERHQLMSELSSITAQLDQFLASGPETNNGIQSRIDRLQAEVAANLRSGRLTPEEARDLRGQIRLVANQANDDDGITPGERFRLNSELNRISAHLRDFLAGGNTTVDTSIQARIDQLETKISTNFRSGNLTAREARDLRISVEALSARENSFDDYGYSPWERSQLVAEIDRINARLNALLANGTTDTTAWASFQAQQNRLRMRINNALASDRLSDSQARRLNAELSRITRQAWMARSSEGFLSTGEISWLRQRQANLQRMIMTEVAAGNGMYTY